MGIQERSSHSIQSFAFSAVGTRGLEELILSLLYEVREYTEWPKERSSKPSSIGTNDPWCLYALLLCITMASPSRSSSWWTCIIRRRESWLHSMNTGAHRDLCRSFFFFSKALKVDRSPFFFLVPAVNSSMKPNVRLQKTQADSGCDSEDVNMT